MSLETAKREIANIYQSVKRSLGLWRYLLLLIILVASVVLIFPNNALLSNFMHAKNRIIIGIDRQFRHLTQPEAALHERLAQEQAKVLSLKEELRAQNMALGQLSKLQNLLGYASLPHSFHIAKVMRIKRNRFEYIIYISGGLGVDSIGDIVFDQDGMIGQVVDIYQDYSRVMLIFDPRFSIAVKGEKSGNQYILQGAGHTDKLLMQYQDSNNMPSMSEQLFTSFTGNSLTSGLYVATMDIDEAGKPHLMRDINFDEYSVVMVRSVE